MNLPRFSLLLWPVLMCNCGTLKSVGHGAKWTYDKAAKGAQGAGGMVVTGAKKIWPFGESEKEKLAAAKKQEAAAKVPAPRVAPVPTYDASKFWVSDAEMGEQKKTAENTTETLTEDWDVTAAKLIFATDYPGSPPNLLRAEGSPAKAARKVEGNRMEVTAQQIHYRKSTGLLVLKGRPTAVVGTYKVVAQSPKTVLIVSLQDGSFHANGPIKTVSISP